MHIFFKLNDALKIKHLPFLLLFTGLLYLLTAPQIVSAQSITLTGPLSNTNVQEGDDFATIELENPWDFNERRDIGWEENFVGTSVNVTNGIWSGSNSIGGGYVFPLFPSLRGTSTIEGLPGDRNLPRYGINHKIDTAKYTSPLGGSIPLNTTSK